MCYKLRIGHAARYNGQQTNRFKTMKKYTKLAAFLSSVGVFCLTTAARADMIVPGATFKQEHTAEATAYAWVGLAAGVCFAVAVCLLLMAKIRWMKKPGQNNPPKKIDQK